MSAFLGKARALQKQQAEVEGRAGQIQAFLEKFILSDAEVASLRHDPIDRVTETGACVGACVYCTDSGCAKGPSRPSSLDRRRRQRSHSPMAHHTTPQGCGPSLRRWSGCRRSVWGAASWWAPSTRRPAWRCSRCVVRLLLLLLLGPAHAYIQP